MNMEHYPDPVMSKSVAMPPTDIMECVVVTPEATLRDDTAQFIVLPLVDGEIGIAPFHSPMIGRLGVGEMRITEEGGGKLLRYYIDGGFVQVTNNIVYVMTQRAIEANKLDPAVAEQQLQEALQRPAVGDQQIAERQLAEDRARAQIRVARKAH
jgi:F-type H+-transporting ATPase subunit epsilon